MTETTSGKDSVFPTCPAYHPLSDLRKRSGYYPNLSAEHLEAFHKVIAKLKAGGYFDVFKAGSEHYFLEALRFLRARKFDVDAALEMIITEMKWREETRCSDLVRKTASDVLGCDSTSVFEYFPTWVQGYDKQMRPISYRLFGKFEIWNILNMTTMERLIMFHAWETEQLLRMMHEKGEEVGYNVETFTIIIDAGGWTMALMTSDALSFVSAMAKTDNSYYPERLGLVIVINAPTMLYWAWKMFEGFLDDVTKAKIKICGTDPHEWQPVLLTVIDVDQLPRKYGGTAPDLTVEQAIMTMDPITPYLPIDGTRTIGGGSTPGGRSHRNSAFLNGDDGWLRLGGVSLVYSEHQARNENVAFVLLILSAICMGCTIVGQRYAMMGAIRPMTFNACRFTISALILYLVKPLLRAYLRAHGHPHHHHSSSSNQASSSADHHLQSSTLASNQSITSLERQGHHHTAAADHESDDFFQQLRYVQKRHEERVSHNQRSRRIELLFWGAVLGIISAAASAFQQVGLTRLSAGKTAFITGLYVIFVPFFECFLPDIQWKSLLSCKTSLAFLVGIAGVVVVLSGGSDWSRSQTLGVMLVLAGAFCLGACLVATDIATKKIEGVTVITVEYQTIAVFSFLLALILESSEIRYPFPSILSSWSTVLIVGITEIAGLILSMIGQLYVTPADAASVFSFQAIVASMLGFLFLQETMTVRDICGCVLMLVAPLILIFSQGLIHSEDITIPHHVASVDFIEEGQSGNSPSDDLPESMDTRADSMGLRLTFNHEDSWNFTEQFSSFFGFPSSSDITPLSSSAAAATAAAVITCTTQQPPPPLNAFERLQSRARAQAQVQAQQTAASLRRNTSAPSANTNTITRSGRNHGKISSSRSRDESQNANESSSLFARRRPSSSSSLSYSQVKTYDSLASTTTVLPTTITTNAFGVAAAATASNSSSSSSSRGGGISGATAATAAAGGGGGDVLGSSKGDSSAAYNSEKSNNNLNIASASGSVEQWPWSSSVPSSLSGKNAAASKDGIS